MSVLGAHYSVPQRVLDATGDALRIAGEEELEGVVLWVGRPGDTFVDIVTELIPPQIAYRSEHGVAVQIPDEAIAQIIAALPGGYAISVRVHSHPGRAYHSSVDDDNGLLSHRGSISIVVPDFAREPLRLQRCSINERDADHRWRELPTDEAGRRFRVT
jgi:hypothetical protein